MRRFEANYFQIQCARKMCPMFISANQSDAQGLGIQIYWSRTSQFPNEDDFEGNFSLFEKESGLFRISCKTEKFINSFIYLGVFCHSLSSKLKLCVSFNLNTCSALILENQQSLVEVNVRSSQLTMNTA